MRSFNRETAQPWIFFGWGSSTHSKLTTPTLNRHRVCWYLLMACIDYHGKRYHSKLTTGPSNQKNHGSRISTPKWNSHAFRRGRARGKRPWMLIVVAVDKQTFTICYGNVYSQRYHDHRRCDWLNVWRSLYRSYQLRKYHYCVDSLYPRWRNSLCWESSPELSWGFVSLLRWGMGRDDVASIRNAERECHERELL